MATTSEIRAWYPEGCAPPFTAPLVCDHRLVTEGGPMVFHHFPATLTNLPTVALKVHHATVPYWSAFVAVMDFHDVKLRNKAGGTINCRTIAGKTVSSLHAHGVAFDILPDDFPDAFGEAVEAITTTDGLQVFNWLGPTFDRMHSQVNIPRGLAVDWSTVPGYEEDPVIQKGASGNYVTPYQQALNNWEDWNTTDPIDPWYPLAEDGVFGDGTEAAVKAHQKVMGVEQTGHIDWITSASILRYADVRHGHLIGADHPHPYASLDHDHPHGHTGTVTVS